MTLIICRGLPGSTKSTWSINWVLNAPASRVRVNRDDLRRALFGRANGLLPDQEQMVTRAETNLVEDALRNGKDVVVDAMHLRASYVRRWRAIAYKHKADFRTQDFVLPVAECIANDAQRTQAQGHLGAAVIEKIAKRFHIPAEGTLPEVPVFEPDYPKVFRPYVPDVNLPSAVLVDLDGTLAHHERNGRSPYDFSRVGEDDLDHSVASVVNAIGDTHYIIALSGRDDSCYGATEDWLTDKNVGVDHLFMRTTGDKRKDAIVKDEIFEQEIRPRFNVIAVIDDRDSVVQMWRDKGLKCLQAQPGNF